ncbi:MAG TPA: S1/P1 nuclease, partial [Fimbriimonadaceae bacterium]|nr:S1/P1 nuclease [Fimbriimonadaceae bacterium]
MKKLLLPCLLALLPVSSFAWIDTGHMVVAAIAERDLKPAVRSKVIDLLKVGGTEKTRDLYGAACWADDTKTNENGPWHYINYYFKEDGSPGRGKPLEENVAWAINKFSKVLANRNAPKEERADALRYILHFVGDAHQPMHSVARETGAHPDGDRGGNDFKINPPGDMSPVPRNLHFLWDIGGGLFKRVERPLSPTGEQQIRELAAAIAKNNPRKSVANLQEQDPFRWSKESFELAKSRAYKLEENARPGPAYLQSVRDISASRSAAAGYRLADLLNRLF